jgi:cytochrome c oxidase subunit II
VSAFRRRGWLVSSTALFLSACAGHQQSAMDAAGPQAGRIETLWWFFFATLSLIFVIVIATLLVSLARAHRGIEQEPLERTHEPSEATERRLTRIVGGATAITIVILFVLLIVSIGTGKEISDLGGKQNALIVEVTGNQWWWNVRYVSNNPSQIIVTANEIHIPVGRPVMIRGMSQDVIHSFWVPNLHGKRDLIPSRVTTEWIEADTPGRYRGQCAEFCGMQHAHMALWVVAESEPQFEAWRNAQLQPAVSPSDPDMQRGQQVFLNSACVLCHSIRGTTAAGSVAPDLTHIGSRISIAAGTLPNTKGNLAGWIADPQKIKPGNHMAVVPVRSEDLQPLADYLESLK